ncbi:oligosaccharide flippase family protein [Paracraurococcus ruber]|uniref:oligosaccharide flippase family protein n=1 Tax=Paracraurococcus ruber TaxID=77675 RepID=UPI0013052536|nr:oligosaccharide flippase family protein [Paracraurococcus ruber]
MRIRLPGPHAPAWVIAESLGAALFSFVSMLAIGRVIGPQDAGTGTVAIAAFLLLDVFGATLFSDAVVQLPGLRRRHGESAATASALAGCVLGLLLAGAGPVLAAGSGAPQVAWLALALAPLMPLSAVCGTAAGLLLRRQRYRILALRLLLGQPLALGTGLLLGLAGCGPWAMIGAQAVATLVTFILLATGGGVPLRPRLHRGALRELWPVAGPQVAGVALLAGRYRIFLLLLGLMVPQAVLALSHFAFRLLDAASSVVWHATGRLALPRLCAAQADRAALAEIYGEIAQLQAVIGLPLALGLALVGPDLTHVLLGPAWAGTGDAVRVASMAAIAGFLYGDQVSLFVALGRTRVNFWIACAMLLLPVAALLLLRPQTPVGAALAWSVPGVLLAPVIGWTVLHHLQRGPGWLLRRIAPALLASLAMALIVAVVQAALTAPLLRLAGAVLAGGAGYAVVLWLALGRRLPAALVQVRLPRPA